MKKQPIGILDGGFEGINIFDNLSKSFPYETFVYINDPVNAYQTLMRGDNQVLTHHF